MKQKDMENLSKASQMDLIKLVQRAIEPFGPYQILLILILCWNTIVIAISNTVTSFYVYTPEKYNCAESGDETILNCVDGCQRYNFMNETGSSPVTDWSLVCDRRYLSALINTIYFSGVMISSLVGGVLGDLLGRRKLIITSLYCQGIFGACLYFCDSLESFITLRFLQGLFIQALYNNSFSLIQELTPPHYLTISGLVYEIFWRIGMVFLGATSYMVKDWRNVQLIISLPCLLACCWSWLIPESLTWNICNGDKMQAVEEAIKIAHRNKDKSFLEECTKLRLNHTKVVDDIKVESSRFKIVHLFKNKILFKHTVVKLLIAFGGSFSYYLILLNAPSMGSGRHISFIIGALVESGCSILALLLSSTIFGRRYFMILSQYLVVAICIIHASLPFVKDQDASIVYYTSIVAIIGKGLVATVVCVLVVYKIELFPTVLRTSALGFVGVAGKIGALSAPQVKLLGEISHPVIPIAIVAGIMFINGTVTFLLPETLNKKLPNSIDDVNEIWGNKQKAKDSLARGSLQYKAKHSVKNV